MSKTVITCWRLEAVAEPSNDLVSRFTSRDAAEGAKKAAGGYGPEIIEETIVIYDTPIDFNPTRFDGDAKESGLAKLTDRERVALGLEQER